ncbi:hypothetical protein [Treponema sp.]|uniref:hypothetical protein n=1 Tax=Treponema sp. TaxID=166 RepID=UPI00298E3A7D|nr:hypothetical protein [Treponema sp.]MCR5614015.1 hypothetical protein [Treponema sp.]
MKRIIYLFLTSFVLFNSCENYFANQILRTFDDPHDECIACESFKNENCIFLSWTLDEACDEYILMRAVDQAGLLFKQIVRTKQNEYIDNQILPGTKYIYRLDKIRGKKYFTGTKFSYGYGSPCRKDFCENNDAEENATWLESDLNNLNLYYGTYLDGSVLKDEDWFYVTVPPRRSAEIVIRQLDNIPDAGTSFMCLEKGRSPVRVSTSGFTLDNPSFEQKKIYFKIYISQDNVSRNSFFVTSYDISLKNIIFYQNN